MSSKLKPVCVLDTCTIINLVYIDLQSGQDFLLRKLEEHFELKICQKVIEEAYKNKFIRIERISNKKRKSDNENERAEIERKLSRFKELVESNAVIEKKCGKDFFDFVKGSSKYQKKNGEFYSAALSLCLSRSEFFQITFYTDDGPAKRDFFRFFEAQQIGKIADCVDLLVFLYWLDPDFKDNYLFNYLSELEMNYSVKKKELLEEIRRSRHSIYYPKNKEFVQLLRKLEDKLVRSELNGINDLKKEILKKEKTYKNFCDKLKEYEDVFDLESGKGKDFLRKIRETCSNLKQGDIYKI